MANEKAQRTPSIEEIIDQIFGAAMNDSKKEQTKKQAQKGADDLWIMYVAFRSSGFSEPQAMQLCCQLLTSQGGN